MADKTNSKKTKPNRLFRSEKEKVIAGVCGGIGTYFHLDPTIIRILFLFLAFFGGSGIILYLLLWAVIPSEKNMTKDAADAMKDNFEDMKVSARSVANRLSTHSENKNQSLLAIILVFLGALFLLDNLNIFRIDLGKVWPIFLIILGILILRRR